eukprot:GILK01011812.1.p1 GENE.GILK01011812.1~~GILK01011812.1.p1  ORF type:complete len:114 (-),score=6.32 GILK01011812.1:164-505(-)
MANLLLTNRPLLEAARRDQSTNEEYHPLQPSVYAPTQAFYQPPSAPPSAPHPLSQAPSYPGMELSTPLWNQSAPHSPVSSEPIRLSKRCIALLALIMIACIVVFLVLWMKRHH